MNGSMGEPGVAPGSLRAPRLRGSVVRRSDSNVLEVAFRGTVPIPQTISTSGWYHEAAIAADQKIEATSREWQPALS